MLRCARSFSRRREAVLATICAFPASGARQLRRESSPALAQRQTPPSPMELLNQSGAYVLAPELAWTGERFERDVRVHVGANGLIDRVTHAANGPEEVVELPGHALLPGMVNAHSHAFQRGLRGLGETYPKDAAGQSSFWTWREEMYKLVGGMTEPQLYELTRQCFSEMRDAGVTSVGEFHYFHHGEKDEAGNAQPFAYDQTVLRAARDVGIRVVLLNAYYEHGGFQRAPMAESQKRFKVDSHETYWAQMDALQAEVDTTPTQTLGVVAHSMRAVEVPDIVKLHEESVRRGLVFHIHLEEQTKEVEDCKATHGETPMGLLLKNLQIDNKFTAVHCTWTEADQLQQFVDRQGNVCICPLTEGNLGDGFPFIASCSDRVCLGTDCNARVDMCEEMRWLEYAHRLHQSRRGVCTDSTPESDLAKLLFRYATKNGAESLNLQVGEIKEGFAADFALVDIEEEQLKFATPESLMGAFIFGANGSSVVKATSVNGKWRPTMSKATPKSVEPSSDVKELVPEEHREQIEAAEALADATSDDVVKLAIGLNSIVSTSGEEEAVGKAIQSWLETRGWQVQLQKVAPQPDAAVKADRYNVYASRTSSKTPKLLFNSHMDTVPPYLPPRTDGKTLFGRGACDAKSLIASQMVAAQKLVEIGLGDDVQLLFVVSEETDHSGMKKANELGVQPEHMVVGEPTANKMSKIQKGVLKIRLTHKGVAAHSGYPHLGDSAIDPMIDVLYDLKKESWPNSEEFGATDLNIGLLSGGQAANALAEEVSAMLMFRLTTEPDVILQRVKEIVAGRVSMELYTANSPVRLTVVEGYDTGVACFNTDVPYFKFDGKAYLVGAGSITDAHCPREFIELDDLRNSPEYYFTLGKRLIEHGK